VSTATRRGGIEREHEYEVRKNGRVAAMSDLGIPACLDAVALRYSTPPWDAEIRRARTEYDEQRGRIYDDDELFETHMALFLEWYVLERPVVGSDPPIVHLLREGPVAEAERPLLEALARSQRSLYEYIDEVARGQVLLRDLVLDGLWRVAKGPLGDGLDVGDLFEARLVPWEGGVRFGPSFFFHPREARRAILEIQDRLRREGRLGLDVTFLVAEMRLRYSRFRNIAVERIYTLDRRLTPGRPGE
jgi:hypothetical protein